MVYATSEGLWMTFPCTTGWALGLEFGLGFGFALG